MENIPVKLTSLDYIKNIQKIKELIQMVIALTQKICFNGANKNTD